MSSDENLYIMVQRQFALHSRACTNISWKVKHNWKLATRLPKFMLGHTCVFNFYQSSCALCALRVAGGVILEWDSQYNISFISLVERPFKKEVRRFYERIVLNLNKEAKEIVSMHARPWDCRHVLAKYKQNRTNTTTQGHQSAPTIVYAYLILLRHIDKK